MGLVILSQICFLDLSLRPRCVVCTVMNGNLGISLGPDVFSTRLVSTRCYLFSSVSGDGILLITDDNGVGVDLTVPVINIFFFSYELDMKDKLFLL